MTKYITPKDVRKQLSADLIGKDSYRGVTLTYSWLANQFGHFSLGFFIALIAYIKIIVCFNVSRPSVFAGVFSGCLWTCFETYNLLGPLLFKKHSISKRIYIPSKTQYTFQPEWRNIIYDTITDVKFFWLGAMSAALFLNNYCNYSIHNWYFLVALALIILLLLRPCSYWFKVKMFLQEAVYPFQFRLSQWNLAMADENKVVVTNFIKSCNNSHLFLFGGKGSGKTSLAVGIATEESIKQKACCYTTGMKLYNLFAEENNDTEATTLWSWRNAEVLVIDDINPGKPIKNQLVNADQFLQMMDCYQPCNNNNRIAIRNKKVIWVMGDGDDAISLQNEWEEMLVSIGVEKHNITCIVL